MGEVKSLRQHSDVTRIVAAATALRGVGDGDLDAADAADLADLLAAVGRAIQTCGRPPLTDTEQWRWSSVVHHARRISHRWVD